MIPLNSRQGLPPNAFWYVALRSVAAAILLVLIGSLFQLASNSSNVACRGLLCGHMSGGRTSAKPGRRPVSQLHDAQLHDAQLAAKARR